MTLNIKVCCPNILVIDEEKERLLSLKVSKEAILIITHPSSLFFQGYKVFLVTVVFP